MWRMLQADEPDDFVLATGTRHTMKQFLEASFTHAGLDRVEHVRFDERYRGPTEVHSLIGDASKAEQVLGWRLNVLAPELAKIMVHVTAIE